MNTRFTKHCLSLLISSALLLPAVNAYAGETTLLSPKKEAPKGPPPKQYPVLYLSGVRPDISADGRFVAYLSGRFPQITELYVLDRSTGTHIHIHDNTRIWDNPRRPYHGIRFPAISADGRFVAFISDASDLVEGDTNSKEDIFVYDQSSGAITRVNVDLGGRQHGGKAAVSVNPAISHDGRFVAFSSYASTMGSGDTNGYADIFVHDRSTGTTARVSVDSAGQQGNNASYLPAISADGRFVAFTSLASNLVPGDTNNGWDVFVHDRKTGVIRRVSVDSAGQQGNNVAAEPWYPYDPYDPYSRYQDYAYPYSPPSISADGRLVAFRSDASNLVEDDTNSKDDIFVHDLNSATTIRVSVDSAGQQGDADSSTPKISADGLIVAFESDSSNLVPGDTNGFRDVFVHNRINGLTKRVSINSSREEGNNASSSPAISADGHLVVFSSSANLGVNNVSLDLLSSRPLIFLRDRLLKTDEAADLQLAVTSQPASVQKGQTASYTYTLTNNGPDNIDKGTKLIDIIANGDLVSLTPSHGGSINAAVSVCRFGALATGASVTLTAVIKARSDSLTQQISVNAPPVDNVPDNNSLTVSTPVTP